MNTGVVVSVVSTGLDSTLELPNREMSNSEKALSVFTHTDIHNIMVPCFLHNFFLVYF